MFVYLSQFQIASPLGGPGNDDDVKETENQSIKHKLSFIGVLYQMVFVNGC